MRSTQKKYKFSQGVVDERLLERQDLAILNSSGSEIINFISTPYGSLKKRQGTIDIEGFEELVIPDGINNNVGDYVPAFNEASVIAGGFYQSGDISTLADDSEVFTIDLGTATTVYEFNFQMYFDGVSNYGDVGIFTTDVADGVLTRVRGYDFQNIKTPVLTPKETAITLSDMTGSFKVSCGSDVFTEEMTTILLNASQTILTITEFISTKEVNVVTTNTELDVLTSNDWTAFGGFHTEVITFTIITATARATTTGNPFTSGSLYNYIKLGTNYCWITEYISANDVRINIAGVGAGDLASWDYIQSTRFGLLGRTEEATGSGALISIPYTEFNGNVPSGKLDIISGGDGYIETTYLYTIEKSVDTLLSSTCMVQKSTDGITYTNVEAITITNSILGGNTPKKIVIDATTRYIRVISDAVRGRFYIGDIKIKKYEYGYLRVEPFVFNSEEQYLIIFSKDLITIYDGDTFKRIITTLTETQINELKVTQQDDVMIITHTDFYPRELTRGSVTQNEAWTTGIGWSYSSHSLIASAVTVGNFATHPLIFNLKYLYEYNIEFEVYDFSSGTIRFNMSNGQTGTTRTSNGIYKEKYTVNTSTEEVTSLGFKTNGTFTGKIRNIKITGGIFTQYLSGQSTAIETTWSIGNLNIINIPKHAFNGEVHSSPLKASTLTPDTTDGLVTITETGTGAGTTFTSASVGQYIDGGGGRVKITDYVSTTKVRGITIIPFYTITAFTSWDYITGYESVWSATRGYPNCCLFYQQRLWFAGSRSRVGTLWGSRISSYNNFLNIGNYSNDAIDITISSNQPVEILSIYPNRGIQIFASGSEWIIPEGNLTPDGIAITKNTANGIIRGVEPIDISGVTMFVEKNGKSLLSFVYNEGQNAYITSQLSLLTSLINVPVDMDVAYNSVQNEANYAFLVNTDGSMVVACILLDQKINSYVKFLTDGDFKSVCVLGDDVYIVTNRDSGTHIEKFDSLSKVDCRKSPLSLATIEGGQVIVTVDNSFVGQEIQVYSDGGLMTVDATGAETYTVGSGGTVMLRYVDLSNVYYGYPIDYTMTSNKVAVDGQTGSIHTRIAEATVETLDTNKLTFCNDTIEQEDSGTYQFKGCTDPATDTRFTINGTYYDIEILSILLRINSGSR